MSKRLVVIAGPANTGKFPLARKLMAEDPSLALVHRDDIRRNLSAPVAEGHITGIMGDMVARLLSEGYSVVVCAWNMEPEDMALWTGMALKHGAPLVWLDVRAPEVEALIPPLQAA